ncbi:hypothetical protein MAC_02760 [Metarhizium acridum CQMa 102]|uniref:Uncharacterized protein n=1 Tax=Metarhizium acridum (strain CQMa 102) TaxID=655827 RepID=E9DYR2_METAQ|nr:uncharacterized protein MAC_02760 [Metarhizium acridum CQMa 102]EFY91089.1 hypothetical protein MAC_02760 [Metarhizium acridum CQMa 102]
MELCSMTTTTKAASYWTCHLSTVSSERRPDPLDLIALCRKDSRRLENWVEQWRRPNCSYVAEYDFPEAMPHLDPLVDTAMFGPAASLADLLRLDLHGPDFAKDSAWTAVTHVITRDHIPTIKTSSSTRPSGQACATLHFPTRSEWGDVFDFLVRELREDLLDHGNGMLCLAARSGCLALVKKPFVAAERDGDLRRSILAVHRKLSCGNQFLGTHQSIGEAACEGHADIVRSPCQQTNIEPHLPYASQDGNTMFHLAARGGNTEVFRILIQWWPEVVHLRDHAHDTSLVDLIYRSPGGEAETVNLVRLLLS